MTKEQEIQEFKEFQKELEEDQAFRELCLELKRNPKLKHFISEHMNQ